MWEFAIAAVSYMSIGDLWLCISTCKYIKRDKIGLIYTKYYEFMHLKTDKSQFFLIYTHFKSFFLLFHPKLSKFSSFFLNYPSNFNISRGNIRTQRVNRHVIWPWT